MDTILMVFYTLFVKRHYSNLRILNTKYNYYGLANCDLLLTNTIHLLIIQKIWFEDIELVGPFNLP